MKDYVWLDQYDNGHTHIDALCHVVYECRLCNDRPEAAERGHGPAVSPIEVLRNGLLGRGVPRLEPGEHVCAVDLEAAGREQLVWVGAGDIVLVRTGHSRRLVDVGPLAVL